MIVIKMFNKNTIPEFEFIQNSRIDCFPIYKCDCIPKEYGKEIFNFLKDKSKLILTLRILKLNKITKREVVDPKLINVLQFLYENYNSLTVVQTLDDLCEHYNDENEYTIKMKTKYPIN